MVKKKDGDKKSDFLSVRIPAPMKEKLAKIAKKKERSLSWIIGKIIEKYLQSNQGEEL